MFFLFFNSANSQLKNIGIPAIRNFKKSDYHGATQNWNIEQYKNGNIFCANNSGLLQFNGIYWTKHLLPNGNSARCLKIDKSGNIFVGSFNEFGFFQINRNGKYIYQSISKLLGQEVIHQIDFIWKIHLYNGAVVFQSFQNLYIYRNNKLKIIPAPNQFQFSFLVNNNLYIQDKVAGLLLFNNEKFSAVAGSSIFNNTEIWSMTAIDSDKVIISTIDKGLFIFENNKIISWNNETNDFLKKNSCLGSTIGKNNCIIFNSVLDGIIISDITGKIIHRINQKKGLQNNTVLTSFVDSKNNLWLGLDNGISFANQNSPFSFVGSSANISTVYASVVFKNRLYVATNQGLFFRSVSNNGNNEIFELVAGTNGQAWNIQVIGNELFCAHNRGAFLISDFNKIQLLDNHGYWNFKLSLANPDVLFASNYNSFAIFEKSAAGWKFKNTIKGFSSPPINFEIDNDCIWVKKDDMIFRLKMDSNYANFIDIKTYSDLFRNSNGNCSIQKLNNKIYFQSNNRFYNFSLINKNFIEDKMMSNLFAKTPKIKFLKQDGLGNIWFAYNESLGVFMKIDNKYINQTEKFECLSGNLVNNYLSINTINSNNIFIGLVDGLAHFDAHSKEISLKPKAFFGIFSYAKDTLFVGNFVKLQEKTSINYDANNVKFSFSSPAFENVNSTVFSYRLEGFDENWSSFSTNSYKEYTNLFEGNYKMKLKTRSLDGLVSDVTTFNFKIAPPFYRSVWAYLFYLLAIIFLVYIIRLRIKAKIRKNKYYETIEQRKLYLEKESKIRQEQYELEKEIEKLKNEKLQIRILNKDKELVSNSLQVVKKNKILNEIITKIKDIDADKLDESTKSKFNKLNKSITKEVNPDRNWSELEKHIKNVHFDFLKRLKDKYPAISPRELDLSTYLLMNMSTKEIAEIMNISGPGVELARYRLRKKLNLINKENLTGFMMSI